MDPTARFLPDAASAASTPSAGAADGQDPALAAQTDPAEQALLARLRAGDQNAFADVVRMYGGRMLAVTLRLLRNQADAEDAVQDAFISAFRSLDKFEGHSRLSTWLHRIAVNAALMKLRKASRLGEVQLGDLLPEFLPDGHARRRARRLIQSPDADLQNEDVRRVVQKKIDELPDAYRTVLILRDIEGLDTRQSAEMLGLTEAATKVRLHRARQALRTLLEREPDLPR